MGGTTEICMQGGRVAGGVAASRMNIEARNEKHMGIGS